MSGRTGDAAVLPGYAKELLSRVIGEAYAV